MIDDIKRDRAEGTPGPWRVSEPKVHTVDVCHSDRSPGAITETLVAVSLGKVSCRQTWRMEGFANARRIARVPDMEDAIIDLTEENTRLREALADAGAMRDAADAVSEWFCTEARHLEGHRINALRMAMVAYDRHMQPGQGVGKTEDEE